MNLQHVVFAEGKFWIQNPITGQLNSIQFGPSGGGVKRITNNIITEGGYTFAGTFTAQNILDNGVVIPNATNVEPLYVIGQVFVRLDIISLQANEIITDMVIKINEAFTYSVTGVNSQPAIFLRTWVAMGFQDSYELLPIGVNPNAPNLQKFVNTFGNAQTYTYKAQSPYMYSLFFADIGDNLANIKDEFTGASGSISVWYKKTILTP